MESEIGQFSSKFCQWVQSSRGDKSTRDAFPAALRKVIRLELPRRDDQVELVVRELIGSEGLACRGGTETQFMLPNGEEDIQQRLVACDINITLHDDKPARLLAFTLTPLWRGGFNEILPNRTHYELITDFLWFASQYVARSRATNLIGAIALTYDRACDFRFGSASLIPYSAIDARPIMRSVLQFPSVRGRERRLMAWVDALNALDPYIHRIVYHYARAVALKHAGFAEEAVVSLDRLISVSGQLILNRFKRSKEKGDTPISIISNDVPFSDQEILILHNLNNLRHTELQWEVVEWRHG